MNVNIYPTYFSYKHAVDGMYRVYAEEGFMKMYSGASMASSRAVLVTVGQVCGCTLSVAYVNG